MRVSAPFFIVGGARSGTTMLRLMLDAHPDVAIPPESNFIPRLVREWPRLARGGRVDADEVVQTIGRRLDHMRIPRELAALRIGGVASPTPATATDAIFRIHAEREGASRWADKTPGYVEHLPLLARLFPESRFVHIVRDGRDVALSCLEVGFGPRTIPEAARAWSREVGAGHRDGRRLGSARYHELRYEDLVDDPETQLKDLCAFLEMEFAAEMLRFYENAGSRLTDEERPHHPNVVGPATRLRDWRNEMEPSDVEDFEAVAGRLLSTLGYERRSPKPPADVRVRAFLTMRRLDLLAARVRTKKNVERKRRALARARR